MTGSISNNKGHYSLAKSPTGIKGLDEITEGGLPKGRSTLIVGSAGSGKTLLATEFLVRGIQDYKEPGIYLTFEESAKELGDNTKSLGFNLSNLIAQKKLIVDCIELNESQQQESGDYNLEGLFIRLGAAIDAIKAQRVVIDAIESLFSSFTNDKIVRIELKRLFNWLKTKGVTAIITGERGINTLTRFGLEEYIADCAILLDQRVNEQISTRRLRVIKYRGSYHGTNEYPFLITINGLSILPITSLGLDYRVSNERISTGMPRLDTMLGHKGFYKGSSILISGSAGTGKSSFAATFANSVCQSQKRCLYFAFEESAEQIMRNMLSIGINLGHWVKQGLLQFSAARPSAYGLEMHLLMMYELIKKFEPAAIVIDPMTNLKTIGTRLDVKAVLSRLIDFLKSKQITAVFISLTADGDDYNSENVEVGISSLMDTWIKLQKHNNDNGENNLTLRVLKSRGMDHSNQIREVSITSNGIHLEDVYVGLGKVLTGSARLAQETQEKISAMSLAQDLENKRRAIGEKRKALEAQIAALNIELEGDAIELRKLDTQKNMREQISQQGYMKISKARMADIKDSSPRLTKGKSK